MDLTNITVSERSQTQKCTYYMTPLTLGSETRKIIPGIGSQESSLQEVTAE